MDAGWAEALPRVRHLQTIAVASLSGGLQGLSDAGRADLFPAFSPDGRRIAFTSAPAIQTDGGNDAKQGSAARRVWIMAADGTGKGQLTDDPAFRDERQLWSADGARLLFIRVKGEQVQLWLMNADGSDPREVVDELTPSPQWFGYYGYIDWSQLLNWWSGPVAATSSMTATALAPTSTPEADGRKAADDAKRLDAAYPPTPTPITRAVADEDHVWDVVARSVQGVSPILRPNSLPSGFDFVQMRNAGQGTFWVEYTGPGKRLGLGAGAFNPPPWPEGEHRAVVVRGQAAELQIKSRALPSELVQLWWNEPGQWVPAPGVTRDHIFYLVSAEGFDPEDVLRLSNTLREVD